MIGRDIIASNIPPSTRWALVVTGSIATVPLVLVLLFLAVATIFGAPPPTHALTLSNNWLVVALVFLLTAFILLAIGTQSFVLLRGRPATPLHWRASLIVTVAFVAVAIWDHWQSPSDFTLFGWPSALSIPFLSAILFLNRPGSIRHAAKIG